MIELSWGQIRDPQLSVALSGLARQRVPYKTTLKILTISKAIEEEQKKAESMAEIIRDKYMAKNPEAKDGEPVWKMKDPTLEEELKKAEKDFVETKFKVKTPKIKSAELENTELTAVELFKLENMIEFDGEEKPKHLQPVEGNA